MGMRASDRTFLRRDVLPILERTASISPEASEAAERLRERLESTKEETYPSFTINKWSHAISGTRDEPRNPADFDSWHITIGVDDCDIPYIQGHYFEHGEHAGTVHLLLDNRFGLDTDVHELARWAPFLANAMAVSAGRTSHGQNSYIRNPHGRSGGGDPPPIVPTPIDYGVTGSLTLGTPDQQTFGVTVTQPRT